MGKREIPSTHSQEEHLRKRLWRLWKIYEWPALGILSLLVLGIGTQGIRIQYGLEGVNRSFLDNIYASLQLFVLQNPIPTSNNMALEIARWWAPIIAGYSAIKALVSIFKENIQRFWIRLLYKNHVVICGLGRKGLCLTKSFKEQGREVVVIESNPADADISLCRSLGVYVLKGDGRDKNSLREAGVLRSAYLFLTCGSDGTNAEIAEITCSMMKGQPWRTRDLTCYIHIQDPQLCLFLRARSIENPPPQGICFEFFNIYESAAREIFDDRRMSFTKWTEPHLLIVGLGQLGESMILQAMRVWIRDENTAGKKLRFTVVDPNSESKIKSLIKNLHPLLQQNTFEFNPIELALPSPNDKYQGRNLSDIFSAASNIYVCLDGDSRSLSAALYLHLLTRPRMAPIMVRMENEAGFAVFLREHMQGENDHTPLIAFGLFERVCDPNILLESLHERIARALHSIYFMHEETEARKAKEQGQSPKENKARVPWDELSEEDKESNRKSAVHISTKLNKLGYKVDPLMYWDGKYHRLSSEEVEKCAELEHERWMEEKVNRGWSYGEKTDPEKKTNEYLLPWDKLNDEGKEKNRKFAREIPAILASAGFQLHPKKDRVKPMTQ